MTTRPLCLLVLATPNPALARAQCTDFGPAFSVAGFESYDDENFIGAQLVWDDGRGPALYLGGSFSVARDIFATAIVRWDGAQLETLGSVTLTNGNFVPEVHALAVYDDGSGEALFVGGHFNMIGTFPCRSFAKWDGTSWSAPSDGPAGGVGSAVGPPVQALAVYDDGSGEKLYVGGDFTSVGTVIATGLATWDGTTWARPGPNSINSQVRTLAVHDDGSGPALFIGGDFVVLGSLIVKWDGASYLPLGGGIASGPAFTHVDALESFDDGTGEQLYVGGAFTQVDGMAIANIARWNGSQWSAVGDGSATAVDALRVYDDGNGESLYRTQSWLPYLGGTVSRLDPTGWTSIGTLDRRGRSLCTFDDGDGEALHLGGEFLAIDGRTLSSAASWDGAQWSALFPGSARRGPIRALASHDDGAGPALYADRQAGDGDAVERWNGASWDSVGLDADGDIEVLASVSTGGAKELYVCGEFTSLGGTTVNRIARWNGTQWVALGSGLSGAAYALAECDFGSGPKLYVGGDFASAGGQAAGSIAAWNGSAWSTLGTGADGPISALCAYDSGSGTELYVGGGFTYVGGLACYAIARWNGSVWQTVGTGIAGYVNTLAVFDDGAGPQLYAGGDAHVFGGLHVSNLARWNGTTWSAVPGGSIGRVFDLAVHDDGSGPALFAGGPLNFVGGSGGPPFLARWRSGVWSAVGAGVDDSVFALASHTPSVGPSELWIGGRFVSAGGLVSGHVARWSAACTCPPASYCSAGTTSSGCVPAISGIGTPSASAGSGFVVRIDNVEGAKSGHIFYGLNGSLANPWSSLSSSYLCVKAPSQRTPTQNSLGTSGACDGMIQLDWNQYVATHPGSLGVPFSAGTQVWTQLYFRDPPASKSTNLSNGLTFFVCP